MMMYCRRFQVLILVYVFGLSRCNQVSGLVYPVAFYPFNNEYKASDISCYNNRAGNVVGAKLTTGPYGASNSAYDFAATKTNYIELPGSSYTDTKYSMTILLWIYHSGFSGPIVDYSDGYGVSLWMTGKDTLYGRIISRDGTIHQFLSSNQIGLQYSWHYVGIGYDYSTGIAILWVNGIKVQQAYIGSIELKTDGALRLGALDTDDRYFRGKISCLQVYDKSLTASEILMAKERCKKPGHFGMDCSKRSKIECGGTLSSESGTISSPRYPREYPPNTKCIWKVEIPKGKRIVIRFRIIDLEKASYSCGDYIEVYDGFNTWSTRLVKYCKAPTDKPFHFSSKSNKMKIVFHSNAHNHGKGFFASYITEDIVKAASKESEVDLSVHYTGIVIGVACAALLAALTIIAINHNKQSRRRRSSSSSRHRRSESFSGTDIVVQAAPPSYDIVMRCPELYPPSPQMSPVTSTTSTPGKIIRFSSHRPSPLASSVASSRFICNSSSDDSDADDPPPYPGKANSTHVRTLHAANRLSNSTAQSINLQTVSSSENVSRELSQHPGSTSTISTINERCSNPGNSPATVRNNQNNEHLTEIVESMTESTDNSPESEHLSSCEDNDSCELQCTCDVTEEPGRQRQDTQSSITVGTVV